MSVTVPQTGVNHVFGTTPAAIERPADIIGEDGQPQARRLVLFADVGDWRFRTGDFVSRSFTAEPVTDELNVVDHPYQTGDGPLQATSAGTLPAGIPSFIAATGVLTLTANAGNTETVVIGGKTYTFQTTLTDVDGNVLIGGSASASIDNLIAAITLGAGSGSTYAASTTLHPTVTAAAGGGDTMDATAKKAGAAGNAITTTETLANGSWGAAALTGGVDADLFVIRVDQNRLQVATSKANAEAGIQIDITDAGTGAHTLTGLHNVTTEDPTGSLDDGTGGVKLPVGTAIELDDPASATVAGFGTDPVLTYFWE